MSYTDEEIEMLARFADLAYPLNSAPWRQRAVESFIDGSMSDCEPLRAFRAVLPIWRDARRQGAEDMREKAAKVAETSDIDLYMRAFIAKEISALASSPKEET